MICRKKSKPVIEDPNDRLWDFRFINDCDLEIFWNYKYHIIDQIDSSKCSCGKPIESCKKFEIETKFLKSKKKKLRPDPVIEKVLADTVYRDTKKGSQNETRYLVKYKGYDEVCNEFVEDETVCKLEIVKKYNREKEKEVDKGSKIIGELSNQIENADDSSGEDDEDARASAHQSKPKEIYRLDRERIKFKKRIMEKNVVYALHTNQEMMRHDLAELKIKYPQLIVRYLKQNDWIDDEIEANLSEVEHNNNMKRTTIRVNMNGEEKLLKRCVECLIPNCTGHKASHQTLLQHYITHCGILYAKIYNRNLPNYMPDERVILQIKLALSTKDFDQMKLESQKLSAFTVSFLIFYSYINLI